jgi:hypothetical protein
MHGERGERTPVRSAAGITKNFPRLPLSYEKWKYWQIAE